MDTNDTPVPVNAVPPVQNAQPSTKLPFSSLPMKLTALIFLSILVLGAFVISQKNKPTPTLYLNPNTNAVTANPQANDKELPPGATEIPLTITSPADGSVVTTPNVVITGKTVAGAEVTVNDTDMKADATGAFTSSVILDSGDNIITITSVDPDGHYAERELKLTLNVSG